MNSELFDQLATLIAQPLEMVRLLSVGNPLCDSPLLRLYKIAEDPFEENELSEEEPAKTQRLFRKLNDWIDQEVDVKYTPAINPDYDAAKEARKRPFVDLRKMHLGEDRAIRTIENDPRFGLIPDDVKPHVNSAN